MVGSHGLIVRPLIPQSIEEMQLRSLVLRLHHARMLLDEPEPPGRARLLGTEDDEVRRPRLPTLWALGDLR